MSKKKETFDAYRNHMHIKVFGKYHHLLLHWDKFKNTFLACSQFLWNKFQKSYTTPLPLKVSNRFRSYKKTIDVDIQNGKKWSVLFLYNLLDVCLFMQKKKNHESSFLNSQSYGWPIQRSRLKWFNKIRGTDKQVALMFQFSVFFFSCGNLVVNCGFRALNLNCKSYKYWYFSNSNYNFYNDFLLCLLLLWFVNLCIWWV